MSALKWLGMAAVVVVLSANARAAEDPDYAKMLIGKWQVTKSEAPEVPVGTTYEFTRDAKVKCTVKKGESLETHESAYKVEKDTLTVVSKKDGEEKTMKITTVKMTDKELTTKGEDGKVVELRKQ
jgi:uncharacterized protein (TIGR03066 family)